MNQKDVESCPQKEAIFKVIRTWENARAANAFPRAVKRLLADPANSWQLEQVDNNKWKLYPIVKGERKTVINLNRDVAGGY